VEGLRGAKSLKGDIWYTHIPRAYRLISVVMGQCPRNKTLKDCPIISAFQNGESFDLLSVLPDPPKKLFVRPMDHTAAKEPVVEVYTTSVVADEVTHSRSKITRRNNSTVSPYLLLCPQASVTNALKKNPPV